MTKLKKLFMTNLQRGRKRTGLTQDKFADLINVSTNHLAAMEIGRRYPSEEVFQRIADILEIEPYELLIDSESVEEAQNKALLERYTSFIIKGMKDQMKLFIKKTGPKETE
jgi:transcriptional regulator with XRE-family HTH domain